MRTKPPCWNHGMDCPKKKFLCHYACKAFQAWKAEEEKKKAIRDKIKEQENLMYSESAKKAEYKRMKRRK